MEDIVYEMRQQIYNIINNTDLLISIKYYVIKDVYEEMTRIYQQYIQQLNTSQISEEQQATVTSPIDTSNFSEDTLNKYNDFINALKRQKELEEQQEDDNK